ncbi:MAG: mechanosensitive ion channel family protein [Acidobacteriaceae bacterium]|jgi:MscS family membrane protein
MGLRIRSGPWRTRQGRLAAALLLFLCAHVFAQLPHLATPAIPSAPSETHVDPFGRTTPRGTVTGFIRATQRGDFAGAVRFMQVPAAQTANAETVARQLNELMDRYYVHSIESISDKPTGDVNDGLPLDREDVGSLKIGPQQLDIILIRVSDAESGQIWLISSDTLGQVPEMYELLEETWVNRMMPPVLVEHAFLGFSGAQWLVWAASILLPLGLMWLVVRVARAAIERAAVHADVKRRLEAWLSETRRPVTFLVLLVFHLLTVQTLGFSLSFRLAYKRAISVLILIGVTWLIRRVLKLLFERASTVAWVQGETNRRSLMLLGERLMNVLLVVVAIFAILTVLGVDTKTALAGVGIGGVAVALGAQKSIENILGGIFLLMDNALAVGDRCSISNRLGYIEDITLRSVKLRTDDQSLLSVPAGALAQSNIENFRTRRKTLMETRLRLRYGATAAQLRFVLSKIQELVANHQRVEQNSKRIRLVDFGERGMEIEIHLYVLTGATLTFYEIREQLLLEITEIVEASGSGFAGPTEFVYLDGPGEDAGKNDAAEARATRQRNPSTE